MTHEERLLKDAVSKVSKKFGLGWSALGPDLRRALVRSEILSLIGQIASVENSGAGRLATLALQWGADE